LNTYPNPVGGSTFSVQLTANDLDDPNYKKYRLKLFDLLGRIHHEESGEFIRNEPIEVRVGHDGVGFSKQTNSSLGTGRGGVYRVE
jgi:hypothetical protein